MLNIQYTWHILVFSMTTETKVEQVTEWCNWVAGIHASHLGETTLKSDMETSYHD
jgi:hypothetical protein